MSASSTWSALSRLSGLIRSSACIEIDNNAAERALRGVSLCKGKHLFMGSDAGGQNVNKVSSAVHLRDDVHASSLPEAVKGRLLAWHAWPS